MPEKSKSTSSKTQSTKGGSTKATKERSSSTKAQETSTKSKSTKTESKSQSKKSEEGTEKDYRIIMNQYDPSKNKSSPVLTDYEKTSIIGKRATQIANGSPIFVERKPDMKEEDIAESELYQGKIPFGVERTIGSRTEYWKLKDMIIH